MTKPTATSIVQAAIDANTPAADRAALARFKRQTAGDRDEAVATIAKKWFDRDSLETTNSGADFAESAVWCIKAALEAAYEAGRASR